MRVELLEKILKKKDKIREYLQQNIERINEEEIKSKWTAYNPNPKPIHHLAADGSFYQKSYLGFSLIVFAGYAENTNLNSENISSFTIGDIFPTVIKKTEHVKTLATLFMFLCEAKALLYLAKKEKPDFIIFDGTITSRFIIPFPLSNWFTDNEVENQINNIVNELFKENIEKIKETDLYFLRDDIIKSIFTKLESPRKDYIEAIVSKFAYYEYLFTLYNIFKLEHKPLIIGLAKTSTGTDMLNHSLPDIKLFLNYINELGYSESVEQSLEKLKTSLGELQLIDDKIFSFLYELNIESFYAKYTLKNAINLIEVYQNPDFGTIRKEDILDYLADMDYLGYNYPFKLKKVDNEVRITSSDFEFIEKQLGLEFSITGREALWK